MAMVVLSTGGAAFKVMLILLIPLAASIILCQSVLRVLSLLCRRLLGEGNAAAGFDDLYDREDVFSDDDGEIFSLESDYDACSSSCSLKAMLQVSLPSVLLASLDHYQGAAAGSGSPTCAVCLSAICGEEEVRRLPSCRHLFHTPCIDAWLLRNQRTCPLCRASLLNFPQPASPFYAWPVTSSHLSL